MSAPIYTADNCHFAYQLNWSLSIFANRTLSDAANWLALLKSSTEPDGVRILEHRLHEQSVHQFLLSTLPKVSPSEAIRSVKGRLQYLVREDAPKAFRRNYHIHSIGSANHDVVEQYIQTQSGHHPMADERAQKRIVENQIHDPTIALDTVRRSSHGQFIYNLHVVFVHRERGHGIRGSSLRTTRDTIIRAAAKHQHLLPKAGILSDHIHLALGCNIDESPSDVALSYLNNLAFAHGMKPIYESGAYLGTFGNYDLGAIRNALKKG